MKRATNPEVLPALKAGEVDVGAPLRRWWKAQHLDDVTDAVTLAQAFSDAGVIALGHLAKRLTSARTPAEVKDRLALALAPKLVAEVRGRVAGAGRRQERASSAPTPGLSELLKQYQVQ